MPAEDLVILAVSNEDLAKMRQFARDHQVNYTIGTSGQLGPPYSEVASIPTTFFLDRQGVIEKVLVGYHSFDELKALAVRDGHTTD